MNALLVVHIGETLGHLVRAREVARALDATGVSVTFAAATRAAALLGREWPHEVLPWGWSHNQITPELSARYSAAVERTNEALVDVLRRTRPSVVLGFPGIFTCQAARAAGVPHISVVHGVYLSGAVRRTSDAIECAVLDCGTSFFEVQAQRIWRHLTRRLGFPPMTYADFLDDEILAIVDPHLDLVQRSNRRRLELVRGSYGPPLAIPVAELSRSCLVTFGSGNSCDLGPVVDAARRHFEHVLVGAATGPARDRVRYVGTVAHSDLAGRVAACASHGGLGTVATFGAAGTPQLVIPTEVDQATTAVHLRRNRAAAVCGLASWAATPTLGRRLSATPGELDHAFGTLAAVRVAPRLAADGACQLAALVARYDGGVAAAS